MSMSEEFDRVSSMLEREMEGFREDLVALSSAERTPGIQLVLQEMLEDYREVAENFRENLSDLRVGYNLRIEKVKKEEKGAK